MVKLIVVGKSETKNLEALRELGTEIIQVSSEREALDAFSASTATSTIAIARAEATASPAQLMSILKRNAVSYLPVMKGDDLYDVFFNSADGVIESLASGDVIPTLAFTIPSESAAKISTENINTIGELFLRACILAASEGDAIETGETVNSISADVTLIPKKEQSASALQFAIANSNIEDLFPNHAWEQHGGESAAASYHTLAALFLRFGDKESAKECLRCGDQLEDSPRALALKAIIAMDSGETLGAVANMVSSLQQYELRKTNDGTHYLNFAPHDIEVINVNLAAGLEALNRQDNETALSHFADAVFSFDSFYQDLGVARKSN